MKTPRRRTPWLALAEDMRGELGCTRTRTTAALSCVFFFLSFFLSLLCFGLRCTLCLLSTPPPLSQPTRIPRPRPSPQITSRDMSMQFDSLPDSAIVIRGNKAINYLQDMLVARAYVPRARQYVVAGAACRHHGDGKHH